MSFRVVIPTAGTGSRLGLLTKHLNKSLISVGHRPTLSHQIEMFPADCEFVIALGHKGGLVRQFLELAYPQRQFYFVEVLPFEGPGSGLGYSLSCCVKYLQQPFVFLSCDTLVTESIPEPSEDWMGYAKLADPDQYRTLVVGESSKVTAILEKGAASSGATYPYIGLAGVFNHTLFWESMLSGGASTVDQGEAYGLRNLMTHSPIRALQFSWYDTGTLEALQVTRERYWKTDEPNILEKENEAIWFVGDQVIKFSADESFIKNRVNRAETLAGFVPSVLQSTNNMYAYRKAEGTILSTAVTLPLFDKFLAYCTRFWEPVTPSPIEEAAFQKRCHRFYFDKTIERVKAFYETFGRSDGKESINGETMPTLTSLFARVDWFSLASGLPGRFHGDLHFENILWNDATEQFMLLDWRQDFAGDLQIGDIYYDLAKLLHGLIVSHELIANRHFEVSWLNDEIRFGLFRKQELVECEQRFYDWCADSGFSVKKVRILTSLIYLNIAALHQHPYALLLFALGKRMLNRELGQS
jgi:NDP-sugar pyrophosphorylase family protein